MAVAVTDRRSERARNTRCSTSRDGTRVESASVETAGPECGGSLRSGFAPVESLCSLIVCQKRRCKEPRLCRRCLLERLAGVVQQLQVATGDRYPLFWPGQPLVRVPCHGGGGPRHLIFGRHDERGRTRHVRSAQPRIPLDGVLWTDDRDLVRPVRVRASPVAVEPSKCRLRFQGGRTPILVVPHDRIGPRISSSAGSTDPERTICLVDSRCGPSGSSGGTSAPRAGI